MTFGPPKPANHKPPWRFWPSKINQSHFSIPLRVFGFPNSPAKLVIHIGLGQKYYIRPRIVIYNINLYSDITVILNVKLLWMSNHVIPCLLCNIGQYTIYNIWDIRMNNYRQPYYFRLNRHHFPLCLHSKFKFTCLNWDIYMHLCWAMFFQRYREHQTNLSWLSLVLSAEPLKVQCHLSKKHPMVKYL